MNMLVGDESPSEISDKIKNILFTKTADRIDDLRPVVASSLFGNSEEGEE